MEERGGNCGTNEPTWKEEEKKCSRAIEYLIRKREGKEEKKGLGRECVRLPFFGPKDIGGKEPI